MKRSIVINKLREYLLNNHTNLGTRTGYYIGATEILKLIEELGMLPPRVESAYKKWGFNPYDENNYWEPEDE
jgi:hypothetical protein